MLSRSRIELDKRQQVILVAACAMQQQKRRSPEPVARLKAMNEGERRASGGPFQRRQNALNVLAMRF